MRLFVAINFGNSTVGRLLDLCEILRAVSSRGNFSLPENLHLTLAFLGECDARQTAAIKSAMDQVTFAPFELAIERTGLYRRDDGDLWWAGVREDRQLLDMQRLLADKLNAEGFAVEKRKYSPHITLGRKVSANVAPRPVAPFGEMVTRIDLMKSERINGKLTYTAIYKKDGMR